MSHMTEDASQRQEEVKRTKARKSLKTEGASQRQEEIKRIRAGRSRQSKGGPQCQEETEGTKAWKSLPTKNTAQCQDQVRRREATGQGESGSKDSQAEFLHIRALGQPQPKDL